MFVSTKYNPDNKFDLYAKDSITGLITKSKENVKVYYSDNFDNKNPYLHEYIINTKNNSFYGGIVLITYTDKQERTSINNNENLHFAFSIAGAVNKYIEDSNYDDPRYDFRFFTNDVYSIKYDTAIINNKLYNNVLVIKSRFGPQKLYYKREYGFIKIELENGEYFAIKN